MKKPLLFSRNGDSAYKDLSEAYPQIAGNGGFPFESFSWQRMKDAGVDVLFLATPHEFSRELVPEAISRGFRVIDLSGAWRLKDAANRAVYGFNDEDPEAAAQIDDAAVYGLPELHADDIKSAALLANPGCYPDVDHSGAGAVDAGGLCRCGARRDLRLEVGRVGSREGRDSEDALRGSGRRFCGV